MESLLLLGHLGRPHGIRGDIRLEYYADSLDLLQNPLFVRKAQGPERSVKLVSWRQQGDGMVVHLEGVDDRTAAEAYRNLELLINEDFLPEQDSDEESIYLHSIIGLKVLHQGRLIGEVEHVLFPPGQELWSIRGLDGEEILFPAVPEFVEDIDLDAGKVHINPPEGLLEINKA